MTPYLDPVAAGNPLEHPFRPTHLSPLLGARHDRFEIVELVQYVSEIRTVSADIDIVSFTAHDHSPSNS